MDGNNCYEEISDDILSDLSQSQNAADSNYSPDLLSDLSHSQDSDLEIESDFDNFDNSQSGIDSVNAPKVIVSMPHLLDLLCVCREPNCGSSVSKENMKVVSNGSMLRVYTLCNNNHSRTWESSPMIGTGKKAISATNVQLASFCLLTGLHIKQLLEFLQHMNILCFGSSFFYNLQKTILSSIIWTTWQYSQAKEIENVLTKQNEGEEVNCSGDGKFDSPGYTASYCTYTIQEQETKAILAL